jgi:HEAT repeat protein
MSNWDEAEAVLQRLRSLAGRNLADSSVQAGYQEGLRRLRALAEAHPDRAANALRAERAALASGRGQALVAGALAEGLAAARHPEAAHLLEALLRDPAARAIREDVAELLGELGDPTAAPALLHVLADPEPWVRAKAADSLGQLGHAPAAAALIGLLDDESGAVRARAADALGRLRAKVAIPALIRLAEHDEDETVRDAAAEALAALRATPS